MNTLEIPCVIKRQSERRPWKTDMRAVTAAIAVTILPILGPGAIGAQEVSVRATYDNNVFRLTEGQKANLGSGSDQFADMMNQSDFVMQIGVGGEIRRGKSSRRLRLGVGAAYNAYRDNRERSHTSVDAYVSKAFTKRDEITVSLEMNPSEFRRNYLGGSDALGAPIYMAGRSTTLEGEVAYTRRLIGGSGPDLDVEIGVAGGSRSVPGLEWRDRSQFAGSIEFDVKLVRAFHVKFGVTRARATYTNGLQPVLDQGVVSMIDVMRDWDQTSFRGRVRFGSGTRLSLEYQHRMRTYRAELGQDAVYGGREDTRDSYEAEIRFELSKSIDLRLNGRYQTQLTLRPATGVTGDEIDYNRRVASVQLSYSR